MAYSSILKPSAFMNTVLYTGNGGSSNSVTGVGFKPDWVWIKNRTQSGDSTSSHALTDVVRGVTKTLRANTDGVQTTDANGLTIFGSDGFTVSDKQIVNGNNDALVGWNWKAGTSFSNSAGANGATIASTGSINTTSGFSIISYTGNGASSATLAHGLGAVPKMMLVKRIDASASWFVYDQSIGANNQLKLNNQEASSANQGAWNNTTPTSSVFSIGNSTRVNDNNGTYIAYIFSEVQGYSKFASYTGNGNANGTFVYTGFKPAWILVKITTASNENWMLLDNKRDGFNDTNEQLFPNTSDDEEGNDELDILSNGFKLRRNNSRMNGSGGNYIYWAFAQNPFVASNFNAGTAR